jgi:hypothetical protein
VISVKTPCNGFVQHETLFDPDQPDSGSSFRILPRLAPRSFLRLSDPDRRIFPRPARAQFDRAKPAAALAYPAAGMIDEALELASRLRAAQRVTVLTGAGVSAASGVPTFRGPDGLWRRHRPEELARDPQLV